MDLCLTIQTMISSHALRSPKLKGVSGIGSIYSISPNTGNLPTLFFKYSSTHTHTLACTHFACTCTHTHTFIIDDKRASSTVVSFPRVAPHDVFADLFRLSPLRVLLRRAGRHHQRHGSHLYVLLLPPVGQRDPTLVESSHPKDPNCPVHPRLLLLFPYF